MRVVANQLADTCLSSGMFLLNIAFLPFFLHHHHQLVPNMSVASLATKISKGPSNRAKGTKPEVKLEVGTTKDSPDILVYSFLLGPSDLVSDLRVRM